MIKIPPGPISTATADMLTRKLTLLESLLNLRTDAPLTFSLNNGTPVLGINAQKRIVIKLTEHEYTSDGYTGYDNGTADDDCRYSWVEQMVRPANCDTIDLPGGLKGWVNNMPAVDLNGSATLEDGLVVEAFLAGSGDHWLFSSPGSGSSAICCTGAPTGIYAFSSQVCCDEIDGFASGTFYLFWGIDCTPYIYTDVSEAIADAEAQGLDATVHGICES